MNTTTNGTEDTLIETQDFNPANDPRISNPYQRHPERAVWTVIKTYQRPDGSRYRQSWEHARWGGVFAKPILVDVQELDA